MKGNTCWAAVAYIMLINPLLHIGHYVVRTAKISILRYEGP